MKRTEILENLKEILRTVKTVDPSTIDTLTEDTDFFTDLNVPSTDLINIIAKAEVKLGIEFSDEDVDQLDSKVSTTINLIEKVLKK